MDRTVFRGAAVAAAVLLLSALPLWAQATTSGIQGTVVDPDGNPISGAEVKVTHLGTGLERTATTDENGRFRFSGLPPARYKVLVVKEGLMAPPMEQVLNVGRSVDVRINMVQQILEQVGVEAERPILNTTETEVSTVVATEAIESLPLINRDFTDLAGLAPGAKPKQTGQVDPTKNEDIYRPFVIGAGNGREVNIQIDGGDNNDNAVGTWVQGYTAEAIQEFEVVTQQYKAEYGRASAGVVNVITKSGTNQFDGTAFGLYRNDAFRSENYSEVLAGAEKAESERQQYGASVGGPILQDRLFFFAAYEKIKEDSPTGYSPDVTGYTRTASFAGETFDTSLDRDLFTVKLNANVGANNTAFLRYSKDENEFANDQGDTLTLEPFNGSSFNEAWSLLGNWTTVFDNGMLNEVTVHSNDFTNGIASNTPSSSLYYITQENYDLFTLGRNANTPQATIQSKLQIRDDFSWTRGSHDMKFGVEYIDVDLDDSFLGLPDLPTVSFTFQTGETPDTIDADPTSLARIDEVGIANPSFIPGTSYKQYGLYAQDNWRINERWTVYGGIRYDADVDIFKDMQTGINKTYYEAVKANAPTRFENTFPDDQHNISPRAGFIYRFGGQDNDVLRASFGLFYDKLVDNLVIFARENLSDVYYPALPTLDCDTGECLAGFDPDGAGAVAPLPQDFNYQNWNTSGSPIRQWYDTLVAGLGPLTDLTGQTLLAPSPDWQTPYFRTWSAGWGHRFNNDWSFDLNAVYQEGERIYRIWDIRGRNTGVDPVSGAGREYFFTTDGSSEYISLQTQVRGRGRKYDLTWNLNVSRASGAQDSGASADESGTLDIFSGGNRRYTGYNPADNAACVAGAGATGPLVCSSEADEFGPVSGDQFFWTSVYFAWRFPWALTLGGNLAAGSEIAFWPNAGYDWNLDGFNSGSEYVGQSGSGRGDTYLALDLRLNKAWVFGKGMSLDTFLEVFNLTNAINYGLHVDQRQASAAGVANTDYNAPTGSTVGQPRTFNVGLRFRF